MTITVVTDPAELAELFRPDPETHLYGLADLDDPLWSTSTWYRRGRAVVGRISDGAGWVTAYAMSREDPEATLRLLAEIEPELPSGTWITGPIGVSEALRARAQDPKGPHRRMILRHPEALPQAIASPLAVDDLADLHDLLASDPGGAFFLPSMLDQRTWHGIREGGVLVACAGTHVVSDRYGVAAIGGVLTRPSHRGRGLGAKVTAAVARECAKRVDTVGLNVAEDNPTAARLYGRIGFVDELRYEEVELH